MVQVYAVNIKEEVPKDKKEQFLLRISEEKRIRIQHFSFEQDQLLSLYGEVMIRSKIAEISGVCNEEIRFSKSKYGKLSLTGNQNLTFNLSHSGDWVVCAIGKKEVGIDIEQIRTMDLQIAKRFFNHHEYCDLLKKEGEAQVNYFYDLWTLKESYVKWVGKGLSIPFDSFMIFKNNDKFMTNAAMHDKIMFKQYNIAKEYKLSVCSEEEFAPELDVLSINNMNL